MIAPSCHIWVVHSYEGIFTDQAVAYYEEHAKGGYRAAFCSAELEVQAEQKRRW